MMLSCWLKAFDWRKNRDDINGSGQTSRMNVMPLPCHYLSKPQHGPFYYLLDLVIQILPTLKIKVLVTVIIT
jgi:hypothetical protein